MIIFDLNQLMFSNIMQHMNYNKNEKISEELVRHMVLNGLRAYIKMFKKKYENPVVACDSRKYWRRDVFPFYKHGRKADRTASPIDWEAIFEIADKIRTELKDRFPYKVVQTEGAEADDIIAVLAKRASMQGEKVMILSSDKDFLQLQRFPNVDQYSPILKKHMTTNDPLGYLREHIIMGDRGDGIPNFLSEGNTFAVGSRQKRVSSKNLAEWKTGDPAHFCTTEEMKIGYSRNRTLIDFECIPDAIQNQICDAYDNAPTHTMNSFMNYLIAYDLSNLLGSIGDFQ